MDIVVGDLVMFRDNNFDKRLGVVTHSIPSAVFEGGEKTKILRVLFDERTFELMSWDVKKVNQ